MPDRTLTSHTNFENLRKQAKTLLRLYRAGDPEAIHQFRHHLSEPSPEQAKLADAQFVLAEPASGRPAP